MEMPGIETHSSSATVSLYQLLDPEVLADPYPLYRQLRMQGHVQWDPYLHSWVVTGYDEVVTILLRFLADRTPTPKQLEALELSELTPIAAIMTQQMLFMDPPAHTRLRTLASKAFMPAQVERLRARIQQVVDQLLDAAQSTGRMEVIADFAEPLPAIITADMLGVDRADHRKLKAWSSDFAEVLGNFQHNPERSVRILKSLREMTEYFQDAVRRNATHDGLIHDMLAARDNDDRLTEEEVVANVIVTMIGGQETTTNLIGNGLLTLLRNPQKLESLRDDLTFLPSAIEELLRYEPPSQHTARIAPSDCELGGQKIRQGQAVIAVMAAANRDPLRFAEPDVLDLRREDNRHLAFGWGRHFCFGAPLARMEAQIAFATMLRRFPHLELAPGNLTWRENLGLRGLKAMEIHVA
jgi:pimeloyl-[acyl-carrier protein] synthase